MKILNKTLRLIVFISLLIPLTINGYSQTENVYLSDSYNKIPWSNFVTKLETNFPVQFYFDSDSLSFEVELPLNKMKFPELLNDILKPYNYKASFDKSGNIFITQNIQIRTVLPNDFLKNQNFIENPKGGGTNSPNTYLITENEYVPKSIIVGTANNETSSTTISGFVKKDVDNLPAIGVKLLIKETGEAVITDGSGFYLMQLEKGEYTLIINSFESKEEKIKLKILSSGRLDFMIESKLIALDEVIVSSEKEHIIRSTQMGYQKIVTKEVKEIPLVLGESDIIKVSMLLPGIQSVGEGSSGINVRGSPTDQNLYIINNIPIYNSFHLFGFFSAFNSDALESFSLYKSNIPLDFGGRLSSVFEIKAKKGNKNNFSANGGISPITARLLVEGPIKDKGSYMVGFRSTYSDWLLRQVKDPEINNSNAEFSDFISNLSFEINQNNKIEFLTYNSSDKMQILNKSNYQYANSGGSFSWNHLIYKKHSLQVYFIHSQYKFTDENIETARTAYKDNFKLNHSEFKTKLTIRPNYKHTITTGINTILYNIDQGDFLPLTDKSIISPVDLGTEKASESGIFLSDEWALSDNLSLIGGIRYNSYFYLGPKNTMVYSENLPKTTESIIDTINYSNNKIIKYYGSPDLRVAARYIINDNLSVKLSYNQLKQYILMLSNTIAISPTDKWKLSDNHIKPMSGDQFSFGIYNQIFNEKYNISFETYYKTVDNISEYKNGANLIINKNPETDILQGTLNSFGLEFMLKKVHGRFNGWLNYTYSRSLVIIDSNLAEEQINNGDSYPSNYDKPHAVNIVANYKFSRRISLSSNIVYSTGRPITYPVGSYYQSDIKIPFYSLRNEYRIPNYFRVDFSLKLEGNLASKKFMHSNWIFSVYNLTGRKNAYSVYFIGEEGGLNGYKLSIFGVPIVSLTYSVKLGNYAK